MAVGYRSFQCCVKNIFEDVSHVLATVMNIVWGHFKPILEKSNYILK